jgi:hypothetical protein
VTRRGVPPQGIVTPTRSARPVRRLGCRPAMPFSSGAAGQSGGGNSGLPVGPAGRTFARRARMECSATSSGIGGRAPGRLP